MGIDFVLCNLLSKTIIEIFYLRLKLDHSLVVCVGGFHLQKGHLSKLYG